MHFLTFLKEFASPAPGEEARFLPSPMMTRPADCDNGGYHLQAHHERQRHPDVGFVHDRHFAENQGGRTEVANDEHTEHSAQVNFFDLCNVP
jgi:hypothetical protein